MRNREDGYAMAALLAAMAAMAVMLAAAMPVWKTTATREKESELIFRGESYAKAIGRYQRRMGPGTLPPSVDALVDGKFLRKKYKDPITNDDFQLISAGQAGAFQQPGVQQPGLQQPGGQQAGRGGGAAAIPQAVQQFQQTAGRAGGGGIGQAGPVIGGIIGVVSKSTETSFRLYNNRQRYNEWTFVFTQPAAAAGAQQPGRGGANQGQPGAAGRGRGADGREGSGRGAQDGRGRGGQDGRGGQNPPGRGNPFGGQQVPPAGGLPQPPTRERFF